MYRGPKPNALEEEAGGAWNYHRTLTEQTEIPLILLFYYLDTDHNIKCASQQLNRRHVDRLRGDETYGLEVNFGGRWRGWMEVLEGGGEGQRAREVRI